ncbi:FAD-binding protein [Lactiplantibacillus daowaiensis]|uniref:Urocanate reductase n=1 Tax=Lactiplantibacillus daowaiensis TaxID=2559918 RepID=A0ABW1S4A6_9LACO|nr:FAD-binding protein [Lactiplantibacillus daowaiensis]
MVDVEKLKWDATYDTIVLGFGGAGATAARFAADAGAKVLLTDVAPNGHEGGNTRYSAQLIGTGDNFDALKTYYQNLTVPMQLDETMINTYVKGMVNMRDYVRDYLGVEPFSFKRNFDLDSTDVNIKDAIFEYPEYDGVKSYDFTTVHGGFFDAALWKILRQKVIDRADKIDVWLEAPAKHLIQDPLTKAVVGVQIERHEHVINVRALNGVVMAMGGFENNQAQVQDYLGADHLAPLGTLYNRGDGIKMAEEVGADMWHMQNYEALGMLHGMAFDVPAGERARLIVNAWPDLYTGSIVTVGDDGSRYFKEDEPNRHGHIYDHGTWRVPRTNVHPYLVFDQAQLDQFKADAKIPYADFLQTLVKADSLTELATQMHADGATLTQTISDFNTFANQGHDYAYGRKPASMRAFGAGPFYAAPLTHDVLNTQGGPRRNAQAEILDSNQQPIPHLYGAGELGGICANQYQGGGNLAECLIFGKIAGENAAKPKADTPMSAAANDATTSASQKPTTLGGDNLSAADDLSTIELGPNQYLGTSENGIGGQVVVRITYADQTLQKVEVVRQSESADVGQAALDQLPAEMVAANSYDVDVVSGASTSSRALKSAVKDALRQVKVEN